MNKLDERSFRKSKDFSQESQDFTKLSYDAKEALNKIENSSNAARETDTNISILSRELKRLKIIKERYKLSSQTKLDNEVTLCTIISLQKTIKSLQKENSEKVLNKKNS